MKSLVKYAIAVACFSVLVSTGWAQEVGEDTTEAGEQIQETGEGGDEPQEQGEETQEDEKERLREQLRQQADEAQEDPEEKREELRGQLKDQWGDLENKEPEWGVETKEAEPWKKTHGEGYYEGRLKGQSLARVDGRVVTIGAGAGLLVAYFGYLGYLLVNTDLPLESMKWIDGKSLDFQMGFREGYSSERKKRYLKATTIGCLGHYVVFLGLMFYPTNWHWY